MSYKMLPVGSWQNGDKTPWYEVTEDPIVISDENVAEYNLPGRGVLPGEVLVRVQYVTDGDLSGALISMYSDMGKHDETTGHPGIMLGTGLMMTGHLTSTTEVIVFIQGFN